jgi:uncharacterized protein YlbG (UPF0298 family)
MDTPFNDRVGLTVWLYTTKYVNKLKRYGLVHYVSRKMKYAIIYVDKTEKEKTEQNLNKQHFVRQVESCYNCEIPYTFEGVLDRVTELAEARKQEEEKNEFPIFTQLSDWSGN